MNNLQDIATMKALTVGAMFAAVVGVEVNTFIAVIVASVFGSFGAFVWAEPIRPRSRMFGFAVVNCLVGAVASSFAVHFLPSLAALQPPIAFFLSLFALRSMPVLNEQAPRVVRAMLAKFVPGLSTDNKGD